MTTASATTIRTLIAVNPAPNAVLAGMDRVFDALHLERVHRIAAALDHVHPRTRRQHVVRRDGGVDTHRKMVLPTCIAA